MWPTGLDHVVYAAPDLEASVAELERRLGVRASPGGSHPGLGTRNALLALGDAEYLEIIAPDPDQAAPERPRPFGIDTLAAPRVATWAAKARDLDARCERARASGYDPGRALAVSRDAPDGSRLEWRLSLRATPFGDGLVPFLIDWGATPSPALGAASGCKLVGLHGEHPEPGPIREALAALGLELEIRTGPARLVCEIESPSGRISLT